MEELEWSALVRQALSEHVSDKAALVAIVDRWVCQRRSRAITIHWHFTTHARLKLKRLYPQLIG